AYSTVLWKQAKAGVRIPGVEGNFGTVLSEDKLNSLREEQIGQLHELMQETSKPKTQFDVVEDNGQKS
ncbi:hypothetical protein FKM82_006973, partial [Ascaphus truei]